jgi:hypothetical protein
VDWQAFGEMLMAADRPIDALFEREAGDSRECDIRHGHAVISSLESFAGVRPWLIACESASWGSASWAGRTRARTAGRPSRLGCRSRSRPIADGRGEDAFASGGGNIGDGELPIEAGDVRVVAEAAELAASDDLDLVSICTPTDTHVDLAIAACSKPASTCWSRSPSRPARRRSSD